MLGIGVFGAGGRIGQLVVDLAHKSDVVKLESVFVRKILDFSIDPGVLITKDLKVFIKELNSFVASRLLTLGMEEIIIFIFITQLNFNSTIIKIIAQFLVIVFNYIFSKIFVFKKSL